MGGCCGTEENPDPVVTAEIKQAEESQKDVKKILFLGPGGCGKSTLFKQLRKLYGKPITDHERRLFKDYIYAFIVDTMKNTLQYVDREKLGKQEFDEAAAYVDGLDMHITLTEKVIKSLKVVWAEEAVKAVFYEASKLQVLHSCTHFLDDLDRVTEPEYMPTDKDILLQRRPTTGLIEQAVMVEGVKFSLIDVGGQKNERRKWESCFEKVSIVIFVASLSAFDEVLYEDETINSLVDALELFEEICTSHWFVNQNMILFMNKQDLLAEKIKQGGKLTECPAFEDYKGDDGDVDGAQEAIISRFESVFNNTKKQHRQSSVQQLQDAAQGRRLFVHITCAYDHGNVKTVFANVKDTIVASMTSGLV